MAVLLALAAQPGELIPRQTLLDQVWDDAVVLDETLTKAIQVLRGYFADKPSEPTYIRTVPRRGYELIADVGELTSEQPASSDGRHRVESAAPQRVTKRRLTFVPVLILAIATVWLYLFKPFDQPTTTIAVIPPTVLGNEKDLGFVSEAMADYLIDQLSQSQQVEVVARRSSFGMRDTSGNVRAIGEQLGAEILIEGSLNLEGDRLLLTIFVVDTDSGTNIWSSQVSGSAAEISMLQRQVSDSLRAAFKDELGISIEQNQPAEQRISDQAYRKFLEARYQWSLRGEKRIDRSIELLSQALTLAPDYAAAHLAYAQSVAVRPFYTEQPVASGFSAARTSLDRALLLDESVAADVAALEGFMAFKERNWLKAQSSLQHALELAPENVNALYWYSWFLSQLGRYDEALRYLLQAQQLDPVSAVLNDRLAIAYVWVGDLEAAADRYRSAGEFGYLESTQPLSLMMFLYQTRQFETLEGLLLRLGGKPDWVQPVIAALSDPAQADIAAAVIDSIVDQDAVLQQARFGIWMLLGDTERAFRDFDLNLKSPYVEALWSAEAAHLRADPRFADLLEQLGFDDNNRHLLLQP
jgi:DNA-binding winged helix-turn-helix (wHTH) protein/TolB-like protein